MKKKVFFGAMIFIFCFFPPLRAEVVKEISPDGTLTLDSGEKVTLAGILMDVEGISVLKALAGKQNVRFEKVPILEEQSRALAFVFLEAKSVKFPSQASGAADAEEVMLNELLLKIGAARVAENQTFTAKERFLQLQQIAMKKGDGIWSYEGS